MLDPAPGYIAIRIVRGAFREIQKLSHQYSETVAESTLSLALTTM